MQSTASWPRARDGGQALHQSPSGQASERPLPYLQLAASEARVPAPCKLQRASTPVVTRLYLGTPDAATGHMHWIPKLFGVGRSSDDPPLPCLKALCVASFSVARRRADGVLAKARRCPRCRALLAHVFECVGSTLFLDDDPHALIGSFQPAERDQFSERVLAALIVLQGRPRSAPSYA